MLLGLSIQTEKLISQSLTTLGTLTTTGLSVYALRRKTVTESSDPKIPNTFTPAGRKYLYALLCSAFLTIVTSAWGSYVDGEIKTEAEKEGNRTFQEALAAQNKKLVDEALVPELTKQKERIETDLADVESKLKKTTTEVGQTASRELQLAQQDLAMENIILADVDLRLEAVDFDHSRLKNAVLDVQLQKHRDEVCKVGTQGLQEESRECLDATSAADNWEGSSKLLRLLDPNGSFSLFISIEFSYDSVFAVSRTCHVSDRGVAYKCLEFSSKYLSNSVITPLSVVEVWDGGFGGVRLSAPRDKSLFTSPTYGRDIVPRSFRISACTEKAKNPQIITTALHDFPSAERWRIWVDGRESFTRPQVFLYSFKLKDRKIDLLKPNCLDISYDRE